MPANSAQHGRTLCPIPHSPDVRRKLYQVDGVGTTNDYNGWDRFGRMTQDKWYDYTSSPTTLDRRSYGSDAAGNRIW
jgi:hypothetical protein